MQFTWEGTEFLAYISTWMNKSWVSPNSSFTQLVWDGPDQSKGKELATAVFKYANKSDNAIWVYHNGQWAKDKGLYSAIQEARWDDLVLNKEFAERLKRDTSTFFDNRHVYRALNVAWKRGILLIGQPGLGKTETIKLLLKDTGKTALYVKSFNSEQGAENGIRAIFEQARTCAPCILVLEDLDSMIVSSIRSFFLNELDGLENNDGILTIATTNHAERIDDSILNRPSRFDTKYFFDYPDYKLRVAYCEKWLKKVHDVGKLDFEDPKLLAERVADKTEGWSFAFLKELYVAPLIMPLTMRLISIAGLCRSYWQRRTKNPRARRA
ncbi:P-loop containing nucleoside triphosphate hydrolase protein [Calocera viscosa TUFC12733]|uniref:p-loop containing nucleoside triphosphate hydrolase protein n=1 Tax=Calocera viscosa (strain TUFC12733) TaxID=1330018 RepID=A0A167LSQ6_CALVF|nr:P-loop containing nucleoside triphosphate hydrolase protein [Calocera viscosa TUFC12733]